MQEDMCQRIYHEVFKHIGWSEISIFLCGGASQRDKTSYRDKLCRELQGVSGLEVLYPENLFMELLNRNRKKYDLLKLEKFLADNSDYIVIVCESPGSYAELGAFVNNRETVDKVIVLLQTKYKNAKSFIRQGPVAYVESRNRSRVIYYNQGDIDKIVQAVKKCIYPFSWRGAVYKPFGRRLNTLSGQRDFLLLLLYFQDKMSAKELIKPLDPLYEKENYPAGQLEIFYSAAVRWCFKERQITKTVDDKYELTDKGYQFAQELLSRVQLKRRTKIFNDIRMKIMYTRGYN